MKKFIYFLTLVLTAAMFISCEKDNDWVKPNENDNDLVKPNVPNVQHSYFAHAGKDELNLFDYYLTDESNLKNAMIDTTDIRFIRVTSYYSKDDGQRNIHEIEVWSDSVNIAYKYGRWSTAGEDSLILFTTNRESITIYEQPINVTDSNYTMYGRWASSRHPVEVIHLLVDKFTSDFDTLLLLTPENELDSIVTNTVYPDTVWFQMDLRQVFAVDSIKLYLGRWTQIFDIEVSIDGENWILLKPDDVDVITINE